MYMMRTYMPKACLKLLGKKQDSTISRFSYYLFNAKVVIINAWNPPPQEDWEWGQFHLSFLELSQMGSLKFFTLLSEEVGQ